MPLYLRTSTEKVDLAASWRRPDEQFFAAGACHVLAAVLLEAYPRSGLCALLLQPSPGFRGGHVIVADESTAMDWRGCHPRDEYLAFLERERRSSMPGWQHSLIPVEDPSSWQFCRRYGYRHPSQFPFDVIDRAERFREQLGLAGWVPDALG